MKILDINVKYSEVCDAVKSVNINKIWKMYNGKIEVVSFTWSCRKMIGITDKERQ